jgi:hypothetical protein
VPPSAGRPQQQEQQRQAGGSASSDVTDVDVRPDVADLAKKLLKVTAKPQVGAQCVVADIPCTNLSDSA